MNNQISGKGIMEYPNGRKYEGEFLNGKMHGHGKFTVLIFNNKISGQMEEFMKVNMRMIKNMDKVF